MLQGVNDTRGPILEGVVSLNIIKNTLSLSTIETSLTLSQLPTRYRARKVNFWAKISKYFNLIAFCGQTDGDIAKSHWTFFVVHFIPDYEFFVRSKLAPTVRPLSGFKEKPARAKRGHFANFFEGFKIKKFRFSDFSWWFEDSSYVCAKFGVSSTSRISQSVTYAAVYIWDSPSARWGLRPQAPIWVLAKFGDKRSSVIVRAKSHWTFFVVHFIPDHEFFVRSKLAPTVRPLSGFKGKLQGQNRGHFANFFQGFKSKKFRFSDFSRWFEDSSYVCAKFGVSSTSRMSQSVTYAAVYIWDSPSARWGLRPQAPIWVLAKFGDKRSSVIG
ncbi:hypothetical protein J6590_073678 [Homalodisca vitripennis]|nr:hypothetical protein J6590_092041 [Homalodisca vitripennis]KAG8325201.1 hypothetical protein J6590_073678 [Homalodisca vitripennis]